MRELLYKGIKGDIDSFMDKGYLNIEDRGCIVFGVKFDYEDIIYFNLDDPVKHMFRKYIRNL